MNPYSAPLEEMRFALRELGDIERVAQLPGAEILADAELMDAVLDQAARFAKDVLTPLDVIGDRHGARWSEQRVTTPPGFVAAYQQFVEAGWNNIDMPVEYGGQGLPTLLCAALHEIFTSANKAFCYCPDTTEFGVRALLGGANESLKALYVPKLVSGQWAATMNLTEPHAGSDVSALRTRAEPQADGTYRLFGQKIFITCGEHDLTENIVHMVLARITGAPPGSDGISLFVVPKIIPNQDGSLGRRNDVYCAGIERKMGNHGSPTCTMSYGEKGEGAVGWLVGTENKGMRTMFLMVNSARFACGQEGTSMSERAYQQALAYAQERVQGKLVGNGSEAVAIIRHPDVRRMLLAMRSQAEAMRAVAYMIAGARDLAAEHPDPEVRRERQAFVDLMIPIFKGWATETSIQVTSTSIQVHGGLGYIEESGASQPLRDVRVAAIYEGTTGIQAHDLIERKLVRDGGTAFRAWMEQLQRTLQQLRECRSSEVAGIEFNLRAAVASLQEASDWAIENYRQQPLIVLGGSVSLLHLCGIVAGGWQMARAALAAVRQLEAGDGHAAFLKRKLLSARFYAAHVLPQAQGLAAVAMHGGESAMALGEEAF